jgi:serine/threonine-protein kinase
MGGPVIERLNAALGGRYRIERELGEGGMATVYLAQDLKHNRDVALKVLKPELAAVVGAERFVAEIETTANLQHPHILPLFDSGEANGLLFYVMPYVRGESLRDRLDRDKQLGVDEAVDIARKVADALDYAHERGVIHRDVKPGNILLSERGEPLVSDFGIALAVRQAGGDRITEAGLSLGTPHYMSPEQAAGSPDVDARSDVYALACVLYELLAGEPPFRAKTTQGVLAQILTEDPPPVDGLRRSVPPHVAAAIARALEKLPADRFAGAAELGRALGDASFRHGDHRTGEPARAGSWALGAAVLVGLAAGAIAAWGLAIRGDGPTAEYRLSVTLPAEAEMVLAPGPAGNVRPAFALSPHGDALVYTGAGQGGASRLFLRRLDSFDSAPLPGTEAAYGPFFSPGGDWVGFFTDTEVRKVSLIDGHVVSLAPATDAYGGTWTDEDWIYFSNGQANRVVRVSVSGQGGPEDLGLEGLFWPDRVPGHPVLVASSSEGTGAVVAVNLETGERVRIAAGRMGRFVSPGHIVFLDGNTLWAVPFDPGELRTTGDPVPVVEGVRQEAGFRGGGHLALSQDGMLAYVPGPYLSDTRFSWIQADGARQTLDLPAADHGQFEVSADASQVAVCIADDIWIYDLDRGVPRRLTTDGLSCDPRWSPDGQDVIYQRFSSPSAEPGGIYQTRASGTGTQRRLLADPPNGAYLTASWTPDGTGLILGRDAGGTIDLVRADPATGAVNEIRAGPARYNWPALSPDGRRLAYSSMESGQEHVYVEPYPPTGERVQLSARGGAEEPRWTEDGSRVVFRVGQQLIAVVVDTAPRLRAGPPRVVLEDEFVNVGGWSWDMTDNGSRFLVLHGPDAGMSTRTVRLIFGFADGLRRSAPTS